MRKAKKDAKSKTTVFLGDERYEFKISFAKLFDSMFLQPLKVEIKRGINKHDKKRRA